MIIIELYDGSQMDCKQKCITINSWQQRKQSEKNVKIDRNKCDLLLWRIKIWWRNGRYGFDKLSRLHGKVSFVRETKMLKH